MRSRTVDGAVPIEVGGLEAGMLVFLGAALLNTWSLSVPTYPRALVLVTRVLVPNLTVVTVIAASPIELSAKNLHACSAKAIHRY